MFFKVTILLFIIPVLVFALNSKATLETMNYNPQKAQSKTIIKKLTTKKTIQKKKRADV